MTHKDEKFGWLDWLVVALCAACALVFVWAFFLEGAWP